MLIQVYVFYWRRYEEPSLNSKYLPMHIDRRILVTKIGVEFLSVQNYVSCSRSFNTTCMYVPTIYLRNFFARIRQTNRLRIQSRRPLTQQCFIGISATMEANTWWQYSGSLFSSWIWCTERSRYIHAHSLTVGKHPLSSRLDDTFTALTNGKTKFRHSNS